MHGRPETRRRRRESPGCARPDVRYNLDSSPRGRDSTERGHGAINTASEPAEIIATLTKSFSTYARVRYLHAAPRAESLASYTTDLLFSRKANLRYEYNRLN